MNNKWKYNVTMIEEDYVSFEIAKLMKENGFDERCTYYYKNEKYLVDLGYTNIHFFTNSDLVEEFTAPTLQMAMKWLREVHKIFIEISVSIDLNGDYHYSYSILNRECKYVRKGYTDFDWNYEQACETALKFCLEHLI